MMMKNTAFHATFKARQENKLKRVKKLIKGFLIVKKIL